MTENDIKYRQGRSRKQVEDSERLMFYSSLLLGTILFGIIIWGLLSG